MADNKSAILGALQESEAIVNQISNRVKLMLEGSLKDQVSAQLSEAFETEDEEETEDTTDTAVDEPRDEVPSADADVVNTDDVSDASVEGGEEASVEDGESAIDPVVDAPVDGADAVVVDEPVDTDVSDVVSDVVDATGMSDDDLIQVFKKVTDNTEIEVVKNDDNTIEVKKDGQEYVIKINEDKESFLDSVIDGAEPESFDSNEPDLSVPTEEVPATEDDVIYEVVLDSSEDGLENNDNELEETRTHTVGRAQVRKPEGFLKYASSRLRASLKESVDAQSRVLMTEATNLRAEKETLLTENAQLKDELEKHKDGLRKMNGYLTEALLMNQKIFHVNKLFCEHSTTIDEKKSILERFDDKELKSEKDIQMLYKTIATELKGLVKESVESKISNNNIGGTGKSLLSESKQVQGNEEKIPGLNRMKELMGNKKK